MSDQFHNAPHEAHADRLRALENETIAQHRPRLDNDFDSIREYSRAWHEDRTAADLLRKSWADPVNRWFIVAVLIGIGAIWTYLLTQ